MISFPSFTQLYTSYHNHINTEIVNEDNHIREKELGSAFINKKPFSSTTLQSVLEQRFVLSTHTALIHMISYTSTHDKLRGKNENLILTIRALKQIVL